MVVDFNYATVGLKVTFENLSTRVPSDYTYHWDFGDNTQSTLNNPTHEFDKPGFYKVILVVKDPASNTVGSSEQRVPVLASSDLLFDVCWVCIFLFNKKKFYFCNALDDCRFRA